MLPINEIIKSYVVKKEIDLFEIENETKLKINERPLKYPCVLIHYESEDDEPMCWVSSSKEYVFIYPERIN